MYVYSSSFEINEVNVEAWLLNFKNNILPRYNILNTYYIGQDDLNKVQTELDKSNKRRPNIIHSNLAKMIVTNACGYFMGKPVTYVFKDKTFENQVDELLYRCDEQAENQTLAKNASKLGVAFELMAVNENKQIYIQTLDPLNTFFVVDDTINHNKICAVTFWNVTLSNKQTETRGYIYTKDAIYPFTNNSKLTIGDPAINPFTPCIPVFEFKNNDESTGDYEDVKELLSAYSKLISANFDDVDSIANAILALLNANIDDQESKELAKSRILQLIGDNVDVKYLTKNLDKDYVDYLRKALREDIFSITNIPDMTDEKFAGNQTGVALSYKLIGFENLRLIKKNYFTKGLMQRFTCLLNYKNLTNDKKIFSEGDVEITFYTNLPSNIDKDKLIADLYNAGVLSLETTLTRMETVTDTQEELKKIENEKPSLEDILKTTNTNNE